MRNYKPLQAEFIGTFCLVFCGTGAVIVNQQTHGQIGHAGVSAVFGLIVMAMIYTFATTSGAHFNPAVTIGFVIAGSFSKKLIVPYCLAQIAGGLAASYLLRSLFPLNLTLGCTLPSGSLWQSFFIEIVLGFMLMLVIIKMSHGAAETGTLAGIVIGATVLLEAMFAGPISGASMNPVRSLAPAIASGRTQTLWIYLTAPFIGTALASLMFRNSRLKLH